MKIKVFFFFKLLGALELCILNESIVYRQRYVPGVYGIFIL